MAVRLFFFCVVLTPVQVQERVCTAVHSILCHFQSLTLLFWEKFGNTWAKSLGFSLFECEVVTVGLLHNTDLYELFADQQKTDFPSEHLR